MNLIKWMREVLSDLARELEAADLRAVHKSHARLQVALGELVTLNPPTLPEERAKWDAATEPTIRLVRRCESITRTMRWPHTKAGVQWSPLWLTYWLSDLALYLAVPPLDSLYDTPASVSHDLRPYRYVPPPSAN